jgi:hypothetical protein
VEIGDVGFQRGGRVALGSTETMIIRVRSRSAGGEADFLVVEVAAGVFGPGVARQLLGAHAGVAVADVEVRHSPQRPPTLRG